MAINLNGTKNAGEKVAGKSLRAAIVFATAVAMAAFQIYTAGVRPFPGVIQRVVHLVFVMVLVFLMYPFRSKATTPKRPRFPWRTGLFPSLTYCWLLYLYS